MRIRGGAAAVIFLGTDLMSGFHPFVWLYDVIVEDDGLRFVVFRKVTVCFVGRENIEKVMEIGPVSIGALSAFNFKNRFLARSFMIRLKRGWFARQVLITPADARQFEAWAGQHGISVK